MSTLMHQRALDTLNDSLYEGTQAAELVLFVSSTLGDDCVSSVEVQASYTFFFSKHTDLDSLHS